jgi:hypothetical protein
MERKLDENWSENGTRTLKERWNNSMFKSQVKPSLINFKKLKINIFMIGKLSDCNYAAGIYEAPSELI